MTTEAPPPPPKQGGLQALADSPAMDTGAAAERVTSVWLDAWQDPVAGLQAYSPCVRMADLAGDGEWRLLVADASKKLKVWKGTSLQSEHNLLEPACAIASFYSDTNHPRLPAFAVAAGPFVFIYRNLRPYYKFTLPTVEIEQKETEIWGDLRSDKLDTQKAFDELSALRESGVGLTSRSLDLLAMEEVPAREAFVNGTKNTPLVQQTCITCMETIKKNMEEPDAVSCIVIGTEAQQLIILDATGTSVLNMLKLPSVPVFLAVSGMLDVDYRIIIAGRDGNLYTVKNGEVTGMVIELEAQPCGLVRTHKSILVGCMNNVVHSFHVKGKKNYSIYLPASIVTMELLSVQRQRMVKALLVALSNGEVRVYNEKHLVSIHQTNDPVMGLRFGRFGREDNTMIMTHKSGTLSIKILPRHANLEVSSNPTGPPPEQDIPLNVPKKTKLYVEQTQREREQAIDMHRIFQRDLCKLRLSTARAYVKVLTDGQVAAHSPLLRTCAAGPRR
ncbi:Bardet-Biedl syndrome 1 protein [Cymbomonas tetramitiformis]|uniref:Bardet-Biedl syndrome 1 protein n=1 Tax=Cymbomonas tetramitiformis TaxID=36881 RepID=A0AAE0EWN0_9CHLO|nr:Bardet-Biedl syndrome 1 protein [Cymbomonas tetramitiformis]